MTTTNSRIFIENIGVGLSDLSNLYKLDLNTNEYLVVGERTNNEYNLIVNNNGIGVNTTRKQMRDTNAGLLVNNNIICNGTLSARNLKIDELNVDSSLTSNVLLSFINKINSNLLFFNGYSNNLLTNIYTPYNVSIGNYNSTYSNSHLFKITDSPIGKLENIQFAIYNNINNEFEPAKITFGLLGYNQYSPASINTTYGMPFEFHISKNSSKIDELYLNGSGLPEYKDENSNYPQLAIDINGCVNINKNKYEGLLNPKLYVNGSALISNIYMYDNYIKSNLHLDDIYMRKNGLTLNANQIKGGDFIKQEFTFNSNVNIGKPGDNYLLTVNNSANITNTLTTDNFIASKTTINGTADFNELASFNANVIFNEKINFNKSINVSNDIFIDGIRLTTTNINNATNSLNFDNSCNLNISGRFGTGILNTDTYDHQFNIIKRNKDRFEIFIEDYAGITTDSSKVYMGHTTLNNLYGNVDNSFVILTQKNIRWHNIYFYPGKDKEGCHSFKTLKPTLAIMQNNRIGINNNLPQKTLDITGDIISDDYFIRKNNTEFKINNIYVNDTKNSCLDVNSFDINLEPNIIYNNKKTLNLKGGINSYDGYYNNNYKLGSFHIYNNYNNIAAITENQVGIGVYNTGNNYSVPLQIRNNNTSLFNNSIIRLYRGVKGGGFNNNSTYTGIDFCDYDMPIKTQNRNFYKWFIYKNNNTTVDNVGTLQIGYTDNTYNPTHSCMNFYYNQVNKKYFIDINNPNVDYKYDTNNAVAIKGNVEIDGNINLKGTNNYYKINGSIIGSFSNSSGLKDAINVYNGDTTELNDISMIGNKLIFFPTKTTIFGFKDDWIFNKINNIQNTNNYNSPVFIYNNKDYYDDFIPPVITKFYNKSYKNYISRPDIAIIELGILTDTNDEGIINNKVDFKLKGYNNNLTIFEITPNNNNPFITCINRNNKNQINVGNVKFYNSSNVEYENTCFHINDDYDCLLKLTNNNKPVNINFTNNNNNWDINANENFSFNLNSKKILSLTSNSFILSNTSAFIDANTNTPAIELTNTYINSLITNITPTTNTSFINIPNSNVIYDFKSYHYDTYDDNFDTNISVFKYKIDDSNLPIQDFNYYINNSNFIFNNTRIFNIIYNIYNIQIDYKYLDNINVDVSSKTYEIIPTLKTFNTNLNAIIKDYNIISKTYDINNKNLILNYKVPKTVFSDQLYIDTNINNLTFTTQIDDTNIYCNLRLTTFLKVKDKTLFDYNLKTLYNEYLIIDNGSNYYINTVNNIYYYPVPNFNVSNIEINYAYNYNYRNDITLPKNFYNSYNNNLIIDSQIENEISIYNSNTYFKNEIENLDITNFKKVHYLTSNQIIKLIPININGITIAEMPLKITKKDYFEVFNFGTNEVIIKVPIYINNYLPHIILKNNINSKYSSSHKIYSYNNNYEIYLDNKKLISIDSNANLNTRGSIEIKDIYFTGDIYNKTGNIITSITSNLTHTIGNDFYIHKNNISMNSSNIILNPSIINKGGVIINSSSVPSSSNNLFQINNYNDNDNFITLKSVSKSAFAHFHTTESIYKFGTSNNSFGIWKTTDNTNIECSYIHNNFNNYSNLMLFHMINNSNIINLNGHIKTTNNFEINDITTYVNNTIKLRVFGNIKIDGDLLSSSDKRLKTNINKIENPLHKIDMLTGITFNNISNQNKKGTGLIAQEVLKVMPEAVYEDDNGYLSIAYGNLIGLLIEGIKELKEKIKN